MVHISSHAKPLIILFLYSTHLTFHTAGRWLISSIKRSTSRSSGAYEVMELGGCEVCTEVRTLADWWRVHVTTIRYSPVCYTVGGVSTLPWGGKNPTSCSWVLSVDAIIWGLPDGRDTAICIISLTPHQSWGPCILLFAGGCLVFIYASLLIYILFVWTENWMEKTFWDYFVCECCVFLYVNIYLCECCVIWCLIPSQAPLLRLLLPFPVAAVMCLYFFPTPPLSQPSWLQAPPPPSASQPFWLQAPQLGSASPLSQSLWLQAPQLGIRARQDIIR